MAVRRLPFTLPDFTRCAWVSDAARDVWARRLRMVSDAWREVQWLSVAAGVRRAADVRVPEPYLRRHARRWRAHGLRYAVLARESAARPGYTARALPSRTDGGGAVRVGFAGDDGDLAALREAWSAGDHETLGVLLGYPECCRAFFTEVWARDRCTDPTWAMAGGRDDDPVRTVSGDPLANVLWRWLDVRAVPHLPCGFDCGPSAELGAELLRLSAAIGFDGPARWCREILSWPVEWSSLHGIAEIRTPIVKICTATDALDGKRVVRRAGTDYPEEGAHGLRFPYRMRALPAGRAAAERRGFAAHHLDNDFPSELFMDVAHRNILAAAAPVLGPGAAVADLGCGNGALLRRLRDEAAPGLVPYGVDAVAERVAAARRLWPEHAGNFVAGDLFTVAETWAAGRRYRLVLLCADRLEEAGEDRTARLLAEVAGHADWLLLYSYGGRLDRRRMAALGLPEGTRRAVALVPAAALSGPRPTGP